MTFTLICLSDVASLISKTALKNPKIIISDVLLESYRVVPNPLELNQSWEFGSVPQPSLGTTIEDAFTAAEPHSPALDTQLL